jgi:hypothetical protein
LAVGEQLLTTVAGSMISALSLQRLPEVPPKVKHHHQEHEREEKGLVAYIVET